MVRAPQIFCRTARIFTALLILSSCAHTGREPASLEKVRSFKKTFANGSSLIVVGIEAPQDSDRVEVTKKTLGKIKASDGKPSSPVVIDPSEFGFEAPKDSWIVPKYLVTRGDRMGPQKVFVFEGRGQRLKYKFYGNKHEFTGDNFNDSDLPPELIEVGRARSQLFRSTLTELALATVTYSPLVPLTVYWREKHREALDWSRYHATYWEKWINQALDNPGSMPDFENNFSRDDLTNIGFALAIRFNHNWSLNLFGDERWEGILTSERDKNKLDLFAVYRGMKKNDTEKNIGQLVKVANEQGLVLVPFGPSVAFLFYDKTDLSPKEHWRALSIDSAAPADIENLRKKSTVEKGNLVPIGIYVLSDSTGPLQLSDLSDPLKVGLRSKVYKHYKVARRLGYGLFLSGVVSTALRIGEFGVRWVFRKAGKPWFDYHLDNYAELDVLLDSGVVSFDPEQVVVDSFCTDLGSWGLSEERGQKLCSDIQKQKADPEKLNHTLTTAIREMSDAEKRTGEWMFASRAKTEPQRLLSTVQFMNWLESEKRIRRLGEKIAKKDDARLLQEKKQALSQVARDRKKNSEAPVGVLLPKQASDDKSLIVFMVDGLASGEIETVSKKMDLPNIKKLFIDAGMNFNVYTPRSLAMPSWGTLLTGYDPDEHGLRSNAVVSKIEFRPELLTDARKDLLLPEYIREGRSHRKLMESGVAWMPRALPRDQVLTNFMPINDGAYPPIASLMKQFFANFKETLFGTNESVNDLDTASANATADEIRAHPGKNRLVLNWYATLDVHTHSATATKFRAYKVLDAAIGKVIKAASRDPVLKNAAVVLMSDHGFIGGLSPRAIDKPFTTGPDYMNDTAFNLTKYFAGDDEKNRDLRFVVAAAESPEPLLDFKYLREFMIHPFSYTYRGAQKNRGMKNILVDYSGDRLAQVFVRRGETFDLGDRMSLHDLRQYDSREWGGGEAFGVDLPARLLSHSLRNLESTNPEVVEKIRSESAGRPVEFFAMALPGLKARQSVDQWVQPAGGHSSMSDRPPVIVCSYPWKCGLIQTRRENGQDYFRYFVVKNLEQDREGVVTGSISIDPQDDPIHYLGTVLNSDEYQTWRTDREWLRLAAKSENPTIIFGLVKALTNSPRLSGSLAREAELPDFILTAFDGFNFNSSRMTEGDHGAFCAEESKITFVVSGIGESAVRRQEFADPRLSRDVGATLFDLMGLKDTSATQGQSLLGGVEEP